MKRISLLLAFIATTGLVNAQNCPTSYKRNNGNGACTQGAVTFFYASCPTTTDVIDSLYVNGSKFDVTFGAPSACSGRQNGVTYCITSSNTPPTGTWKVFFRSIYVSGAKICEIPEGGPLPINLTSFYAKRMVSNVVLSWATAYEQNANTFEIERAIVGKNFEKVGSISASNKATGSAYSFVDANNSKSTMQYRLKMIDLDGTFKYSEIRTVKGSGSTKDFSVFPNPSNGSAKVTISDIEENTDVQVLDNTGRVVKTVSMNNTNNVMLNGLEKGMYMIRIVNKMTGESITKKLTVVQ